jgi:hypothetical protein
MASISFPNLPDEPRTSRSPGTAPRKVATQAEGHASSQPKPVDYRKGDEAARRQYSGWYLDWSDKILFGRRIEGPRKVMLKCWAVSQQHAEMLLAKKAKDIGAALGGVQGIAPCHNDIVGA